VKRIATVGIALGCVALLFSLGAYLLRPEQIAMQPMPFIGTDDGVRVVVGAEVYRQHCAACHGARLKGQPNWQQRKPDGRLPAPPHDASGHTWHHGDEVLFRITKLGPSAIVDGYKSDMPGFENVLSDDEIRAVLAFIKSTWPERERQYQELRTRAERGNAAR
jgi:mono/diheme cytochrome c family protein